MAFRAISIALIFAWLSFDAFAQVEPASTPSSATTNAEVAGYLLGPGDQLRIIVYGEPDLTGDFTILPNGNLAFPLIGEIGARGLSATQLSQRLQAELQQGYVRSPRVSVSIAQYRPFYILGEVQNPGTYPYAADLSVMSAVATAGGFTYRANRRNVYIRRAGSTDEQRLELNGETRVMPGDTIRIGERFF